MAIKPITNENAGYESNVNRESQTSIRSEKGNPRSAGRTDAVQDMGTTHGAAAAGGAARTLHSLNVQLEIEHDLKIVVGTSGWSETKLAGIEKQLKEHPGAAVVVVPNFSIGSMLLQLFSAEAARHFASVEIIEAHHAGKVDSPSGTAIATAEKIAAAQTESHLIPGAGQQARGEIHKGVPIHSLRQPGVSAKQEVIFGGDAEQLTLSHDVSSHRAYSLGILRSIEFAHAHSGLAVGLDAVLK